MMDVQQDKSSRELKRGDSVKAGAKRLFSNRSKASDHESDHDENDADEESHSGKRQRAADWPLPSVTPAPSTRAPLRNRNAPNSPSSVRRPSSSQVRASKFLEGSMNDRISHVPPTTYIGEEEARDLFDQEENGDTRGRKMARPKGISHQSTDSVAGSATDRSDVSRHSIFRFGKSIAASFNPSNWKIFNKPQEEVEETIEQQILRERREKAEAMYQELKQSGHFRDSTFHTSLFQHQEAKASVAAKHDSGVVVEDQRARSVSRSRMNRFSGETTREEKRQGKAFFEPPQAPAIAESHFSHSPASTHASSRKQKSKFHFKKPSLSNIKKSASEVESVPNPDDHQARRVPSRRDLQKQQKLVKRVSDLEGKLDAARRQLAETLDEPLPPTPSVASTRIGRSRFVPGAMPSLPSERLLSGYIAPESGMSVSISQIGKAITIGDSPIKEEHSEMKEPTREPPPPPDFDKSLPVQPDTPEHDRLMDSIEASQGSNEVEATSIHNPVIQSVKACQVQVVTTVTAARSEDSISDGDGDADSDYELSDSNAQEMSASPSAVSSRAASKSTPKKPTKGQGSQKKTFTPVKAPKSKKRKTMDDEKTYKPTKADTESDTSSLHPRRAVKKAPASSQPARKLQKTSTLTLPSSHKPGPTTPMKKTTPTNKKPPFPPPSSLSSPLHIPVPGPSPRQQSASPPPSGDFIGVEYAKPSKPRGAVGVVQQPKMASYGATPGEGDAHVPPMPRMPSTIRLASGEVLDVKAAAAKALAKKTRGADKPKPALENRRPPVGGSKLSKARPSLSPRKDGARAAPHDGDFEWPEDVF